MARVKFEDFRFLGLLALGSKAQRSFVGRFARFEL